jgi:hypothetical protein
MAEQKNEFIKIIEQITTEIEKFNEALYNIPEIDGAYCDLVEDLKKENKITKKEARKLGLELLKKQCPKFIELLTQIDLLAVGMEARIQETVEKLEDTQYKLDEIEELQNDIEDKKNDLDI